MAKPTTIRIPEGLLREIDYLVRELKVNRSDYPREILRKGFTMDKEDRTLQKYLRGEWRSHLSLGSRGNGIKINYCSCN